MLLEGVHMKEAKGSNTTFTHICWKYKLTCETLFLVHVSDLYRIPWNRIHPCQQHLRLWCPNHIVSQWSLLLLRLWLVTLSEVLIQYLHGPAIPQAFVATHCRQFSFPFCWKMRLYHNRSVSKMLAGHELECCQADKLSDRPGCSKDFLFTLNAIQSSSMLCKCCMTDTPTTTTSLSEVFKRMCLVPESNWSATWTNIREYTSSWVHGDSDEVSSIFLVNRMTSSLRVEMKTFSCCQLWFNTSPSANYWQRCSSCGCVSHTTFT